ncbi:MAG: nuclear transport factor 2 family protein [Candidatus Thiodiazotropha endolucinida]|uniref:SnoaL-like domain protein n=1 Tax=Candidatus Thiodiazotropha endolucinida TaxID=1655433 RepID=A0A7Z0VHV0_9GAMM|nr:nuclear transport factor 2 family protein [Candidatus Thiodiazotropha endolucinida]ODJ85863.1 snoaL-like domain protein [Candidatus Thiodiazotropha endolucinida]
MKDTIFKIAGAVVISVCFGMVAFAGDMPKDIAVAEMASLFKSFDQDAARHLIAKDVVQHNQQVPNGAAPLIDLIPKLKKSGISSTTHRLIAEGNMVVAHNEYKNAQLFGGAHLAAFDVFRVEDGQVVEHWDNITAVTPPNPSGRTQFDGTTEITDLDKTEENKELVTNFVHNVLQGKAPGKITDYISSETYLQHNSGVADGLEGLNKAIKAMIEAGTPMTYSDTDMIIAEGNFVLTASEGQFMGKHSAFYDLFRVDDGKIVEHWDVIQEISEKSANDSGKF